MSKIKQFVPSVSKSSLIIALIMISINILAVFPFGLHNFSFETEKLTVLHVAVSSLIYVLYVAFCIFMWIKRYTTLAKGLFIYQLVGAIAYALYFITFIFGSEIQNLPYIVFHAWSIMFEPLTVALGRISGIRAKYISALLYLLLTFISGKVIVAIKKDIVYEKKYKEDHENTVPENKTSVSE